MQLVYYTVPADCVNKQVKKIFFLNFGYVKTAQIQTHRAVLKLLLFFYFKISDYVPLDNDFFYF